MGVKQLHCDDDHLTLAVSGHRPTETFYVHSKPHAGGGHEHGVVRRRHQVKSHRQGIPGVEGDRDITSAGSTPHQSGLDPELIGGTGCPDGRGAAAPGVRLPRWVPTNAELPVTANRERFADSPAKTLGEIDGPP